jgi:hypothetical protein
MEPVNRIAQYKAIETSDAIDPVTGTRYFGLQQDRWSPTNIADTPQEARSQLFMLQGAHYSDPEFSWKFEIAPAGIGFLNSTALGRQYRGDLFVGAARTFLENGFLWERAEFEAPRKPKSGAPGPREGCRHSRTSPFGGRRCSGVCRAEAPAETEESLTHIGTLTLNPARSLRVLPGSIRSWRRSAGGTSARGEETGGRVGANQATHADLQAVCLRKRRTRTRDLRRDRPESG